MAKIKKDTNFPDDLEFFVSTSPYGLMVINKEKNYHPTHRTSFGITYDFDSHLWFVCSEGEARGRIRRIRGYAVIDRISLPDYCNGKVHQIDFLNGMLYVTVTTKVSEILLLDPKNDFKISEKIIPVARKGAHINSIFSFKNYIYMIAHNKTQQTGLKSSLIIMDQNNKIIKQRDDIGSSCHNYYTDGKREFWCDSHGGSLISNSKVCIKFDENEFIRGLSVSNKYIIIGSTEMRDEQLLRLSANGKIYVFDNKFNLISTVEIEGCQIRDIKQSSFLDLTISNSSKHTMYRR